MSEPDIFELPPLYPAQHAAIYHPARYVSIDGSTKSGKTHGCLHWQTGRVFADPGVHWWVAPVYRQAEIAYGRALRSIPRELVSKSSENKLQIEIVNGSTWQFRSGEKPDNLYGEDVRSAVIDEASRCRDEAWYAVRSTLTATQGPIRAIGNVRGRNNWHYKLGVMARNGDPAIHYAKLTADDAIRGGVISRDEVLDAMRVYPHEVFRELYMCEPSDDGGNPFGIQHIAGCVEPMSSDPAVVWGIDYARVQDWTVAIGLDRSGRVCRLERWRSEPASTTARIVQMVGRTPGYYDATGPGGYLEEAFRNAGTALTPVVYTNARKQDLMEALASAIQQRRIRFPDGVIRDELEQFEYSLSSTRRVQYSAPAGAHDDAVNALALAWLAARDVYAMHVGRAAVASARPSVGPAIAGFGGRVQRI